VLSSLPQSLEGELFELGSGWGGLALMLARAHPHCSVIGVELSPVPWAVARLRLALARLPNCRFLLGDFHRVPLQGASAVVCYLYRGGMRRLAPKLEAELREGALVVSHTFAVPGWKPDRELDAGDWWRTRVHVYRRAR
jgi:cyclopropane fatty-acyl-phospholipid synthase-like methyltransferase